VNRREDVTLFLLALTCICSFLSRYSVGIGPVDIRPEHLATAGLTGWMLADRSSRGRLLRAARDPLVVIFGVFVMCSIVVTAAFAPEPVESLPIVGWLALDVALFTSLIAAGRHLQVVERVGSAVILPWAALGFLVATGANRLGWRWGTQLDPVYEVSVAYVTAYEANIFAAVVTFWGLLLVARRGACWWMMVVAAAVIPLAVLASQTRAAVIGLATGLVVLLAFNRQETMGRNTGSQGGRLGPGLVLAVLVSLYVVVTLWPSAGDALVSASSTQPHGKVERSHNVTRPDLLSESATVELASHDPGPFGPMPSPAPVVPTGPTPDSTLPVPGASAVPRDGTKLGDFSGDSNNVRYRQLVAEIAFRDMRGVRLVTGNGVNTFGQRHEDPTLQGVPGYLGSLPLQILYDTGLIGAALLIAFIAVVLRRIPRSQRSFGYAALLAFAITSTLTSTLWFSTTWIMIAILVMPRPDPAPSDSLSGSTDQTEGRGETRPGPPALRGSSLRRPVPNQGHFVERLAE
jgi:hypothetical protein